MPRRMPEGEAFRHPVSFRMTPDARAKLEAAAKASGRSLSQEIEFRLEASFRTDDLRQIIREEVRAALPQQATVGVQFATMPLIRGEAGDWSQAQITGRRIETTRQD